MEIYKEFLKAWKLFYVTDLILDVEVDMGVKRFRNGNTITDDNTFAGSQIVQIDSYALRIFVG